MQKRLPNVAAAHSTMSSAGASSSSAPTWDTSSRSSSGLRPWVWVPRKLRARVVVGADAKFLDLFVRLVGARYQRVFTLVARRLGP